MTNASWPHTPLDRFILAKLEQRGLYPAPPADKRTLLRRATFDLTGLPPTPEEVAAFLADHSSGAFAKIVERLLASPRYGERWGRHWLDVARYADSNGMDENLAYASAWRYRDYVIAAFNSDKPYDQFIREQLAGDLLPVTGTTNDFERLIATGFLTIGPKMLAEDDPVKMEMDIVDEQLDTASRAFMGLTVGCARCHDHKYDPIPTTDYYAMAGIFKSTHTMDNFKVVARWQERPLGTPAELEKLALHRKRIDELQRSVNALVADANAQLLREARAHASEYLLAATEQRLLNWASQGTNHVGVSLATNALLVPEFVKQWTAYLEKTEKETNSVLSVWHEFVVPGRPETRDESKSKETEHASFPLPMNLGVGTTSTSSAQRLSKVASSDAVERVPTLLVQGFKARSFITGISTPALSPEERENRIPSLDRFTVAVETVRSEKDRESSDVKSAGDAGALIPGKRVRGNGVFNSPVASALFRGAEPRSLTELAQRYAEQFAQAELAWQRIQSRTNSVKAEKLSDPVQESFRQVLYGSKGPFELPKNVDRYYPTNQAAQLNQSRDKLKSLEDTLPTLPEAMAVSDGASQNLRVHIRGSHLTLGEASARGVLASIGAPSAAAITTNHSGRLQFANWLTHPEHPLTARVMANRIWHWHFGKGLVPSPDNFGTLGEKPTHAELLDWLARHFIQSGWSTKAMHRLIMNSAVYQQSSVAAEVRSLAAKSEIDQSPLTPAAALDPENRLLSHFARRRLEVEAIRDSILFVSGVLDCKMGGSLLTISNRTYVTSTASKLDAALFDQPCRSVYLPVVRSALYNVFQIFDFADPSSLSGHRDQTTVAPQALFMLNSKLVADASRRLAAALLAEKALDDSARIEKLYRIVYSRSASELERTAGLKYVERYAKQSVPNGSALQESRLKGWQSFIRATLAANQFIYTE